MHKLARPAVVAMAAFVGIAHAQGPHANRSAGIEAFGKGVQIYTCQRARGNYVWTLKAPDATISDAQGRVLGQHYAGPSWKAVDGSVVVGEPLEASSSPDSGAIPWLVLRAKSHYGNGMMANVRYIVRMRTEGGRAPTNGCDAGQVGMEFRVPYSAVYVFYRN
ncbi:DUF3455 domain-containing protein [Dyella sp. 2HG41-7]|uniref:DUF3455 domain-containing protein n=1 Tax=Dyella sp. 2HG41-7 TaxID=2883239 RepID=UPI001F2F4881|nr:DUF3455 domain-containing protein [Dyella sp. 2HG41-7]